MTARWLQLPAQLEGAGADGLRADVVAGLVTAVLLLPQALAYAMLAGLPPQVGLAAAIVPPVVYALTGSSRVLAVGPVAVAALMVASALQTLAADSPGAWRAGALILAAECGLFLLLLLRLGGARLAEFISHPVLEGFTTGAALLIIFSQLGAMAGLSLPDGGASAALSAAMSGTLHPHLPTLLLSTIAVVLLMMRATTGRALCRVGIAAPVANTAVRLVPLLVVVGSAWLVSATPGWSDGIAQVGRMNAAGAPVDTGVLWSSAWRDLALPALLIAIIAYVESLSVARVLASRRRERVDAAVELRALGWSNLAAAAVASLPVAGGFSRSVVNDEAGARTQRAGIVAAAGVGIAALLLGDLIAELPIAVLAAIIVVAVSRLVRIRSLCVNLSRCPDEGSAQAVTLVGVLVFGIEAGLLLGIALSVALYLLRTSQPHIAVIGRLADSEHFRNIRRHEVQTLPRALFIRIDENLYFANATAVESVLREELAARPEVRDLVLVMSAVSHVDLSGLEMLERLADELSAAGIRLHLAEVKGPVSDHLARARPGGLNWPVHLSTADAYDCLAARAD